MWQVRDVPVRRPGAPWFELTITTWRRRWHQRLVAEHAVYQRRPTERLEYQFVGTAPDDGMAGPRAVTIPWRDARAGVE
jgi:hypothetical protein